MYHLAYYCVVSVCTCIHVHLYVHVLKPLHTKSIIFFGKAKHSATVYFWYGVSGHIDVHSDKNGSISLPTSESHFLKNHEL